MRGLTAGVAVAALAAAVACDGGDRVQDPAALEIDEAPRLLVEDLEKAFKNSYRVKYQVSGEFGHGERSGTLTWYKDGSRRQRFDLVGSMGYSDLSDVSIFLFDGWVVQCGPEMPLTPEAAVGEGATGACYGDERTTQTARERIWALGFPTNPYPTAVPADYLSGAKDKNYTELAQRVLIGRAARCYTVEIEGDERWGRSVVTSCYGPRGELLLRDDREIDGIHYLRLEAQDVADQVTDAAFEWPYPLVDPEE